MPVIFTGCLLGFQPQRVLPFGRLALGDDCPYTIVVRFEWDPRKAAANLRMHRVSFDEAATVLGDDFALTREDPGSEDEQRFSTLGLSSLGNLMVVVYTYRGPDVVRVISAWKADRRQRGAYEEGRS